MGAVGLGSPRAGALPQPLLPVFPHSRQLPAVPCNQPELRAPGHACRAVFASLGGGKEEPSGRAMERPRCLAGLGAGAGLGRAGRAAVLVWLRAESGR